MYIVIVNGSYVLAFALDTVPAPLRRLPRALAFNSIGRLHILSNSRHIHEHFSSGYVFICATFSTS